MYERILAPLLLGIAACASHPMVQSTHPAAPALRASSVQPAVFESSDPNPGRLCHVGTKDCMTPSEMSTGSCMLSTGRCKGEGRLQYASATQRLLLESPVTSGALPEIVLSVER
jgi:hypothetical protein